MIISSEKTKLWSLDKKSLVMSLTSMTGRGSLYFFSSSSSSENDSPTRARHSSSDSLCSSFLWFSKVSMLSKSSGSSSKFKIKSMRGLCP